MLFTIAWRNIWRSPVRSLVVMGAIIIGVWSIIFLSGLMSGMINSYVSNAIENQVSHIQVHHPEFVKEKDAKYNMDNVDEMLNFIRDVDGVNAASSRSITPAMLASSKGARGVQITGVVPDTEKNVTKIFEKIVEGEYFPEGKNNSIVVSSRMAEKLKVKLRSKVVLTFQDLDGVITSGAFRIRGMFDSGNNTFDDAFAYVDQMDLNRLLGNENMSHEIAIYLNNVQFLDTVSTQIKSQFPEQLTETYKEISPELDLFESQIQMASTMYMVIFMLALVFGIINTMLMAVLERIRELGMLMAIGMNKIKVFLMIVLETLLLAIISAPIGLLLGYLVTLYYEKNGLNIFFFSKEGMQQFGMSNFVYPTVDPSVYVQLAFAVALTAVIASLYPAYKAIRLNPMEAIRKI